MHSLLLSPSHSHLFQPSPAHVTKRHQLGLQTAQMRIVRTINGARNTRPAWGVGSSRRVNMCHFWHTMCAAATGIFGHTCWPSVRAIVPALRAFDSLLESCALHLYGMRKFSCKSALRLRSEWSPGVRTTTHDWDTLQDTFFLSLSLISLSLTLSLTRTLANLHTHT